MYYAKIAATVFFLVKISFLCANGDAVEDLLTELNNTDGKNKIEILIKLESYYSEINEPEKAVKYLEMAAKLAEELVLDEYNAYLQDRLGKHYYQLGQYKKAIGHYNSSLKYALELNDKPSVAKAYNNIGVVYYTSGEFNQAISNYKYAIALYEILQEPKDLASSYNNIAVVYSLKGDIEKSLDYYTMSLNISEEMSDQAGMATIYSEIGILYGKLKNYKKSEEYFKKSLDIWVEQKQEMEIMRSYTNLGIVYSLLENYSKSIAYYEKALSISVKNDYDNVNLNIKDNLGLTYLEAGMYEKGLAAFLDILKVIDQTGLPQLKTNAYINTGYSYYCLDSLDQALYYYQKAARILDTVDIIEMKQKVYLKLAELYEKMTSYKESLNYYRQYYTLHDSVFTERNQSKLIEMSTKYETEKKEEQLALQIAENELHKSVIKRDRILIFSLIILMALGIMVGLYVIQRNRYRIKERNLILKLDLLRAQMNPHFIFNALNSIQSCILHEDKQVAYSFHAKFAKLMRLILIGSVEKNITLKDELDMIRLYCDLEMLRTDHKFKYNIHLDHNIDQEGCLIPTMFIQPFVENAIWHGLINKKEKDGRVDISIDIENQYLRCTIEDNGIGRKKAAEIKEEQGVGRKSMGIRLIEQRMKLYNLEHKIKLSSKITDIYDSNGEAAGTRVVIYLPSN